MAHKNHDETSNEQNEKETSGALEHPSYEELEKKLNEADAKANENWDKYVRLQAEVDNVRRRMERDVANAHKYGLEKIVPDLLAVVDSLEQGLSGTPENGEDLVKNMRHGMEMTLALLLKALEKQGIKQINPAVGEAFNAHLHQALKMQEDPDAEPNSVLQVLQKGYQLQDRLLRPALVIVAKN